MIIRAVGFRELWTEQIELTLPLGLLYIDFSRSNASNSRYSSAELSSHPRSTSMPDWRQYPRISERPLDVHATILDNCSYSLWTHRLELRAIRQVRPASGILHHRSANPLIIPEQSTWKKKQNQQFELLLGCTRFALANDDIQFQSPLFCCGSPRTNGTDSTIAMCLQYQRIQYQHRRSKFLPLPMGRPLESPPKGKLSTKSKQSIIINHPYRWIKKNTC